MWTLLVIHQKSKNYVLVNDDGQYTLPCIHFYLLIRQCTLTLNVKFSIFNNPVFQDQKSVPKKWSKMTKKFARQHPAHPPYGAALLSPIQEGAKCPAAVVLDNQRRPHSRSQRS